MHKKRTSSSVRILIVSILISLSLTSYAKVENLRTEYTKTPLGIDVAAPRFGWQMTAPSGARQYSQSAYQIVVKDQDGKICWDSKKINQRQFCRYNLCRITTEGNNPVFLGV